MIDERVHNNDMDGMDRLEDVCGNDFGSLLINCAEYVKVVKQCVASFNELKLVLNADQLNRLFNYEEANAEKETAILEIIKGLFLRGV